MKVSGIELFVIANVNFARHYYFNIHLWKHIILEPAACDATCNLSSPLPASAICMVLVVRFFRRHSRITVVSSHPFSHPFPSGMPLTQVASPFHFFSVVVGVV